MNKALVIVGASLAMISLSPVFAAETTTYTYDAKGRLVQMVKSGGPANGTVTTYEHDKADNRKQLKVIGAS